MTRNWTRRRPIGAGTVAEGRDGQAMNALGALLAMRGDLDAAEAWLRRAITSGVEGARFNLGRLLEMRGDHEAAVAAYRLSAERGDA